MSTATKTRTTTLTVVFDRDAYGPGVRFEGGPLRLPHRFAFTYTVTAAYTWLLRQPGVKHLSYADFKALIPAEGADPVAIPVTD